MAAAIVPAQPARKQLEPGASQRSAAVRLCERVRIVLRAAAGLPYQALAAQRGIAAPKVGRWRRRVAGEGAGGMVPERPCGAHPSCRDSRQPAPLRSQILEVPMTSARWSCRALARHLRTPRSFVP